MGDADPGPRREETCRLGGYVTGKIIGRGGMGTIYEAQHPTLDKRVALKVIKGSLAGEPLVRERFLREAQAVARISHPHVVEVFDLGIDAERAYLVMELLEGETLEVLLARKGRLGVTQALEAFMPVIAAAAAIHDTGVVHRDLKPGNIMLARRGRFTVEPVVLDFGISRAAEAASGEQALTEPHVLIGTLPYLSPEQLRDAHTAGPRSDQYAVGVMLYECLTGRKPFSGADRYELMHAVMTADVVAPRTLVPGIPHEIDRAVLRAISRRPDARFPSMRAFGGALLSAADQAVWKRWASEFAGIDQTAGEPSSAETVEELPRQTTLGGNKRRAGRWLAMGSGALALVVVALLVHGRALWAPAPSHSPPGALPTPLAKTEPAPAPPSPSLPAPAARLVAPPPPDVTPGPAKRRVAPERRPSPPVVAPGGAGTLYVNASPDWAAVAIDGKPAGTTPIVLSNVPAGRHTLEAKALGQQPSMQRNVIIEAGSKARIEFNFGKP